MTDRAVKLGQVVERLADEGLLGAERAGKAFALVERLGDVQPWYVRAMVGFGAWLASLLLIGFVAGFGLAVGGSTVLGLVLIAGAVYVRRQPQVSGNDFAVQSTLAVSLAGQALFAWGLASFMPGDEFEAGCVIVMLVSGALFIVFPDRIHRVLMVLIATSALVALVYTLEMNGLVPFLGPAFAAAFVALDVRRPALIARGYGQLARPLANGVMLSAFGCLLLSTIYLLPELGGDFRFYPRPWVSTLLLGALLLYVGGRTFPALLGEDTGTPPLVWVLLLAVIAAAWAAPGLLLALVVVMLGAAAGHLGVAAVGIAFFAIFLAAYFYGIEVTLLVKSVTLIASGVVILVARWLLLRVLGATHRG